MKKRNVLYSMIGVLALLLTIGGNSWAQLEPQNPAQTQDQTQLRPMGTHNTQPPPPPPPGRRPEMRPSGWIGGPGMKAFWEHIPQEKREQVVQMLNDTNKEIFDLRQQRYTKRTALDALMADLTSDDAKITAAIKDVTDIDAKIFEARMNLQRKISKETGVVDFVKSFDKHIGTVRHFGPPSKGGGFRR